jgi:hypothetical protein
MRDEKDRRGSSRFHPAHSPVFPTPAGSGQFHRGGADEMPLPSVPSGNGKKGAQGGGGRTARSLTHLSRDDLVLYHYREIRTAPAEEHLGACRICRDRLGRIEHEELARPAAEGRPAFTSPSRPRLPIWRRLLLLLAFVGSGRRT